MAGFIKRFLERRRSRKRLKSWTRGWVWAMGELMKGISWETVESHISWPDPSPSDPNNWFDRGADTAVQDYIEREPAALRPCTSAPSPDDDFPTWVCPHCNHLMFHNTSCWYCGTDFVPMPGV
jgi:hypothetical protein